MQSDIIVTVRGLLVSSEDGSEDVGTLLGRAWKTWPEEDVQENLGELLVESALEIKKEACRVG